MQFATFRRDTNTLARRIFVPVSTDNDDENCVYCLPPKFCQTTTTT